MQIQLPAYIVRLILAPESEADLLEVLMAIWAFMVLIVLIRLKRLKIWAPVVMGSDLDSRGCLCSTDGGGFQCSGIVQVWARHYFWPPGHDFVRSTLPRVRCRSGPALRTYNFADTAFRIRLR